MNVAPLVGDIPTTTVTVRTFGAPSRDAYGVVTATPTDASRTVVVHPSGRKELERLGLDFKRETISVYDTTDSYTSDTVRPARVQYQGRWYEVVRVGDYGTLGGLYLIHAALITGAS